MDIYTEYGLDFDNNRFGFGRSTEIEYPDGTERRTREKIKCVHQTYYCRIWIGKRVFVFSRKDKLEVVEKKRNNFKIVFGIHGKLSKEKR